jgi:hypothetical protein
MKTKKNYALLFAAMLVATAVTAQEAKNLPEQVSGVYPSLAFYNGTDEGECGTGAVVPWAGSLWAVTYGPHFFEGSGDKLYRITPDMKETIYPKSIGGTHADRMIHKESRQLIIGPYFIDAKGNVRVVPWQVMPGRLTSVTRDIVEPSHNVLFASMEEGFYRVDVNTLKVKELYKDANFSHKRTEVGPVGDLLPGAHGKGFYSGQGVAVYSNNGESCDEALTNPNIKSGVLAEWNGKNWKTVRRCQFTEVTGPGGIYGNAHPKTDPIWSVGWDYKSIILALRDYKSGWSFYRLPKASHSYDGAHGWNTEWPRIRNVGTDAAPQYMMTMHGMFWHFPGSFSLKNRSGIRPISAYLKVIGDFARWNDRLVFGCDVSAKNEFLNKRKAKGKILGPGQSNSNLWFAAPSKLPQLGPSTAEGEVWGNEDVKAGVQSEPFLFAGWAHRCCWIKNEGDAAVKFSFQVDKAGNGKWSPLKSVLVNAKSGVLVPFSDKEIGEWVRVATDRDTRALVSFSYTDEDSRTTAYDPIFKGLTPVESTASLGGLLRSLGANRRALGLLATKTVGDSTVETGYYEMGSQLKLTRKDDPSTADTIRRGMVIPKNVIHIEKSSVLIKDDRGRRWRLPLGDARYTNLENSAALRICREVATERDLFSCMGSFYELPAENADGFAKIRPISTSNFRVNDYASYRGMMILTGIDPKEGAGNSHIIVSDDGQAAVWAGDIDDLWALGKPVGTGGPWSNDEVQAGAYSDPYLIGFYNDRELTLSHNSAESVKFQVEVDPTGNGDWIAFRTFNVKPGEQLSYKFEPSFQARWIRFSIDKPAKVTTLLRYR